MSLHNVDFFKHIPLSVLKKLMGLCYNNFYDTSGFNEKKRLYLPLEFPDDMEYIPSIPKLDTEDTLKTLGYSLYDYKKGLCKKNGDDKNLYKIGKLLNKHDCGIILKKFNEDITRANVNINFNELEVVISYNPFDIAMMSTGRGWSSCMKYQPGDYSDFSKYIHQDISNGMIIAYLINKNDRKISKPKARLLIKPYKNSNTGEIYYKVSDLVYGLSVNSFKKTVQKWVDGWQPSKKINSLYVNSYDFYIDKGESNFIFSNDYINDNEYQNLLKYYNAKSDETGKYKLPGTTNISGFSFRDFPIPVNYIDGNLIIARNRILDNFNFMKNSTVSGDVIIEFNRDSIKNLKGMKGIHFKRDFKLLKNIYLSSFLGLKDCVFDGEFRVMFNGVIPDLKGTSGNKFNGDFILDGNNIISYEGIEDFNLSNACLKVVSLIDTNFSMLATLPIDLDVKNIKICHYIFDKKTPVKDYSIIYNSQDEITDSEVTIMELKLKYNMIDRSDWDREQIIKRYKNHKYWDDVEKIINGKI